MRQMRSRGLGGDGSGRTSFAASAMSCLAHMAARPDLRFPIPEQRARYGYVPPSD